MFSVQPTEELATTTKKKILKIAEFLETQVKPSRFRMGVWFQLHDARNELAGKNLNKTRKVEDVPVSCGTTACICGWMPSVFPRSKDLSLHVMPLGTKLGEYWGQLSYKGEVNEDAAASFLGIPHDDAYRLFVTASSDRHKINTPKKAAKMLRNYVNAEAVTEAEQE